MNERIEIINNTAYIKANYGEWTIEDEADGQVSIGCAHDDVHYLFLNQTELKQLIEFLQTKVK